MLNSILVRARAHHADVLRQAGSCPSDPAKRQKMKQACRAVGTDCTTHPVSVCTLSLRSSGHFCSCTTVSLPHLTLLATPCSLPQTMRSPCFLQAPGIEHSACCAATTRAVVRGKRRHQGSNNIQAPNLPHIALFAKPYSLPPTILAARAVCAHPAQSTSPAVLPRCAPPCAGSTGIRVQTTYPPPQPLQSQPLSLA